MNSSHLTHIGSKRAGVIIVAEETVISRDTRVVANGAFHFWQGREIALEVGWIAAATWRIGCVRCLKITAVF